MNKIITANNLIRTYQDTIMYNGRVYKYDEFLLAVSLDYINTKVLEYKPYKNKINSYDDIRQNTYDEMKSLFLKSDITENIIYFTLVNGLGKHRGTVMFECMLSLYGYPIKYYDTEYYASPNLTTLKKVTVTDLQVIGLGDVSKVLKYNLDITYDFMLRSKSLKGRDLLEYTKKLRGLTKEDKDLIRLYCFEDFNVFPMDNRIKRVLFKLFNLNITSYDRTINYIQNKFPNTQLGKVYHLLIYNYDS